MITAKTLARQAMAHGGVAILLVYLLTFLDATRSEGGAAVYLVAAWAFVTGLVLSHIFHEWCHFLGSVVGRATVSLKPRVHPLFFEFDLDANSHTQFILLSAGGLCGNVLLLLLVSYGAASHSLVMTSLLAAVAGQLVFVLILELPVSIRVLAGAGPLEALTAHFGQGGPLFLRAAIGGVTTAALIFALSSFR